MCGRHCADTAVMQIVQIAIASAAPQSVGPGPSSSNRHRNLRLPLPGWRRWRSCGGKGTQALLNALFVADICENLCKNGQLRAVQGRNVQTCLPISVNSPTVFKHTVLPPVLGPVMTRRSKFLPSSTSIGTTFCGQATDVVHDGYERYARR